MVRLTRRLVQRDSGAVQPRCVSIPCCVSTMGSRARLNGISVCPSAMMPEKT